MSSNSKMNGKFTSRDKISANHKTNIVHGLIRVVYALQNCMMPRMIIESFENSGMKDFSLEKILKLHNADDRLRRATRIRCMAKSIENYADKRRDK